MAVEMHQIGEVAERLGLSLRTIRYYEEEGLVVPSQRTAGGFRLYSEDDIARLGLVKRMKPLGFTVDQMRDLLDARDALGGSGADVEDASERLGFFASSAQEKCASLRAQLEMAEEFADQLEREHRRARRRRPRKSPSRA